MSGRFGGVSPYASDAGMTQEATTAHLHAGDALLPALG